MIKLKDILSEYAVFGKTKSLFWTLAYSPFYVPLSIPIIKQLVGNIKTTKAAHVTEIQGLPRLLSLKGKKKGISTFTAMDDTSSIMSGGGVATAGGVIVILKGDVLLESKLDAMTIVDKSGRRWAKIDEVFGTTIFFPSEHLSPTAKDVRKRANAPGATDEDINPKEQQIFIKDYIDTVTKLLIKNKDKFQEKYFTSQGYKNRGGYEEEWNEVILTKINIEAIAFIKDSTALSQLQPSQLEQIQKKYKNSEVITTDEIKNFLKKHGIKLYTS